MPMSKLDLAPMRTCTELGFDFQQASKKNYDTEYDDDDNVSPNNKLVLENCLPKNIKSKLTLGPSHQIGVGALMFHPIDSSKMLVVREKSGSAAARELWKMPTGLTDPHEDIVKAVVREVKEET